MIAIDHYPARLALARQMGAEVLNYKRSMSAKRCFEMTAASAPTPASIASHGKPRPRHRQHHRHGKAHTFLGTDRPPRFASRSRLRKGGRVSVPGVYGGMADKFPIGPSWRRG